LQQQLDIKSLRELEDVIIDAIYQGLFQGQLDQKRKQLEVELAMGRDLKPDSVDSMMRVLQDWSGQSQELLKTIKDKIQHATYMNDAEKKTTRRTWKKVEIVKSTLKAALESDIMQAAELEGAEFLEGGKKSRGRKGPGGGGRMMMDPHMMMRKNFN